MRNGSDIDGIFRGNCGQNPASVPDIARLPVDCRARAVVDTSLGALLQCCDVVWCSTEPMNVVFLRPAVQRCTNSMASMLLLTRYHRSGGVKASPYSITERRVPDLIPVLGSQPAGGVSHKPGVGCHYFPPGLQLPPQPLRWLLPLSLLGEQRHDGCEQLA